MYLSDLNDNPSLDVRAYPGDRITLINNPARFRCLARLAVSSRSFSRSRVSLTEAIAQAGGAAPNAGDAAAIFVFRYITDDQVRKSPLSITST
jgi:polysaccharide export outer membrane protein